MPAGVKYDSRDSRFELGNPGPNNEIYTAGRRSGGIADIDADLRPRPSGDLLLFRVTTPAATAQEIVEAIGYRMCWRGEAQGKHAGNENPQTP